MSDWTTVFFFSIISAALLLSIMGLWFVAIMPGSDRWSRRFFLVYFLVFLLCSLAGLADLIMSRFSVPIGAVYFILLLECLLLSVPLPMLTCYLLHCCGENIWYSRLFSAVVSLWGVFVVLLAGASFFGGITYIAQDNQYVRGPLYPVVLAPTVAILLLNLAGVLRRRRKLSRKTFLSFLIAILPMTAALSAMMFVDVLPLYDISVVLSSLSMYGLILSDQIEQDMRRQREIARQHQEIARHQREIARQQQEIAEHLQEIANQRTSIMVLQMRPHFIYNTMTSIYCLCKQDPMKARQVTLDFTTYLHKNFTAIASTTPITFSSELEHTRAYLAVEQAQYEDSLLVEYDTPHTWFRVPPLTLQPIVENAVKHGRDPGAAAFHISIRTRKTAAGSEIVVTDNGRGFHMAVDSEPHIALKNIRERLETMCGGTLTITPNDGGGTVVTVTVPDIAVE